MNHNLLVQLEKELEISDSLLINAERVVIAATGKFEDGTKKPTKKKVRKKRKLTPEQKKKQRLEQKLVKKVKTKLKDKKYKSIKEPGKELSFNTAYNARHPKAKKDFNQTIDKMRGNSGSKGKKEEESKPQTTKKKDTSKSKSTPKSKKVTYPDTGMLSTEQRDVIDRISSGSIDPKNMPVVVERTLREALSILSQIHIEVQGEGLKPEPEPKKKRKTRSDKGKKRSPYKKRVKEKVDEQLPEEAKLQLSTDELVELNPSSVNEFKEVLDVRANTREKQTGEKEPQEPKNVEEALNKEPEPPVEKAEPIDGAPLSKQPAYVQKEHIKDQLEAVFNNKLNPNQVRIDMYQFALDNGLGLSDEEKQELTDKIEAEEKELEKDSLASTRKKTKTLRKQINNTVDSFDNLTEAQVKQLAGAYGSIANQVSDFLREQGLKGVKEYVDGELEKFKNPPIAPPTLGALQKSLRDQQNDAIEFNAEIEDKQEEIKSLEEDIKKIQGAKSESEKAKILDEINERRSDVSKGRLEIHDLTKSLDDTKTELESKKEDQATLEKKIKSTTKDIGSYDTLQDEYAKQLGVYTALQNAQAGITEDPSFGLSDFPMDKSKKEQEKHIELVRQAQGERFRGMEKEDRDKIVERLRTDLIKVKNQLTDSSLTENQIKELEGELLNLKVSESQLNVVRMIKSEGVIKGYHEVPDHLLEVARQTESQAWDSTIAKLSEGGTPPSEAAEEFKNVVDGLSTEDFKAVVGGDGGVFGEMTELLDDDYCPGSAVNKSKGVGDKKLSPGESCPNPLPDEFKKALRDYMSGSFVNLHTVEKESYRDGYRDKDGGDSEVSAKIKQQMKYFWNERKDKFMDVFIDGIDPQTNEEYTEEERIAAAEEFRFQWMENDMKSLREGIQLYPDRTMKFRWEQMMGELKRLKGIDPSERRLRAKQMRETLMKMWDDAVTTDPKPPEEEESGSKKQGNIFNRSFIDPCYKSGGTKTMQKRSSQYVDYQRRSQAFELGMRVYPFYGGNPARSGVIVSIFPAIGMVDVQFPHGASRFPVEDLVVDTSGDYKNLTNEESSIPGGLGTVPVSSRAVKKQANRVASRYMKQAIYWYKKDRTYRQCRNEKVPCCPKCKDPLGATVYKRRDGKSEKLLVCRSCLFIIKPSDILKG